jgi:excisionase family DNA binding protein
VLHDGNNYRAPSSLDLDAGLAPNTLADLFGMSRRAVRQAVAAGRVRSHGRKRKALKVREFLEDADALDPCRADDCHDPALADNGGCGRAGHGRRGRSPSESHLAALAASRARRRDGRLTVPEAAAELDVTDTMVRKAIKDGVIEAVWDRGEWLIERVELEGVKAESRCREDGCDNLTLGKTGYCVDHRGGGNRGKSVAAGTRAPWTCDLSPEERGRRAAAMKEASRERWRDAAYRERQLERLRELRRERRRRAKAEAGGVVLETAEVAARVGRSRATVTEHVRRGWADPSTPSVALPGRRPYLWTDEAIKSYKQHLLSHDDGRMQRFSGADGTRDKRNRRRQVMGQKEAERSYALWCQSSALLDPTLSLEAAMVEVRPTVKARRSVLRLNAGAPRKEELHALWARQYDAIAVWWRGRAVDIGLPIALEDYASAPERWEYNPADEPDRAKRRVYSAVRRHKTRQ